MDDYGFKHSFDDVSLALHYICTQLNTHYYAQSDDYAKLKAKWRLILDESPQRIENNVSDDNHCCKSIIYTVF